MSAEGLEPSTNGLKGHCSAIELRARVTEFYHAQQEASTALRVRASPVVFIRKLRNHSPDAWSY